MNQCFLLVVYVNMKTILLLFLQLLAMARADEIIDLVIDGIYACNTIIFWDYYHGNLEAVKAHSLVLLSIISVAMFCLYIMNKFVIDLYEFVSEKENHQFLRDLFFPNSYRKRRIISYVGGYVHSRAINRQFRDWF